METPDHRPIKEVDCCGVAAELAGRGDHELLSFPSHQHHSQSSAPLGKFARSIDHVHLAVIYSDPSPMLQSDPRDGHCGLLFVTVHVPPLS